MPAGAEQDSRAQNLANPVDQLDVGLVGLDHGQEAPPI